MNIILLGAPGSGKGSAAKHLIAKHGLTHLSTGDLLRAEVAAGTELGRNVETTLREGNLIPDMTISTIVLKKLSTQSTGFLLDGYPRTLGQAMDLSTYERGFNFSIDAVIYLHVPLQVAKNRLLSRGRTDDEADVIENRFFVFEQQTLPVVEYYRSFPMLFIEIDGTKTIPEVDNAIEQALLSKYKQ